MDGDNDDHYPSRIVCLTDETTETLYLLEQDWRIVGISGFTKRPARARREKAVVTSFTMARVDDLLALEPDLVLGFSDIQAEIARQLIAAGIEVHVFNHRTVAGILRMVRTVGAMVGCPQRADDLANHLADGLDAVRRQSEGLPRPRVYFEEWDDPIITSIGWVAELVDTAGGEDLFAEQSRQPLAKDRVVADASAIVRADPDLIIASWCGKRFDRERLESRPGWSALRAVQHGDVYAVDSSILLQPGPAALTDGVRELRRVIAAWQARSTDRGPAAKPAAATP